MKPDRTAASGGHSHGLTFHWPRRPPVSPALAGFFFLSLFAHALAFYIFQVVYPPTGRIAPPPAQVNLLASTPENQALLRWVESEDPAAIANPHEIIPKDLCDAPYQPSFAEIRTAPKPVDENETPVYFSPAQNVSDIVSDALKPGKQPFKKLPARQTELKFSGPLAARGITSRPPLKFDAPGSVNLDPASFFVGVGADGKVRYTFLINSYPDHFGSGDGLIDRQAEAHLRRIEFAPGGEGIAWGIAAYFWGNDTCQSSPQP